jgi:membrane protease YdiL (CAAX protease family)
MLAVARAGGADLRGYGIARDAIGRGWKLGIAVGLPLGAISAAGAFLPQTRRFFQGDVIVDAGAGEALYHALLRIPHGTAVSEELMFRTALEATLARHRSRRAAALIGAALFGLWHILPAIDRLHSNPGFADVHRGNVLRRAGVVASTVATTAIGGLGFSYLRERSGSILAPILVHAAVNAGAFSGGWVAHRIAQRRNESRS